MREAQKLDAQAARSDEYISQSKTAAAAIIAAFDSEGGLRVTLSWPAPGIATAAAESRQC